MRIRKWITIEREEEFSLDIEDLRALILEAEFDNENVLSLINRAYGVLRSIPLEKVGDAQREMAASALRREADRFDPKIVSEARDD